jgi:hypothetical protein
LIITAYKKSYEYIDKLIINTVKNKGKILYNFKDKDLLRDLNKNYQKIYSFGKEDTSTLRFEETNKTTRYIYLQDIITIRKNVLPGINNELVASSLLIGKIKKIDLTEGLYAIIKYGLPGRLLMQIKANLKV